jgi:T-complex protein 1 subunit eta
VAFKKTFSYAGFEQQPKRIEAPKILCLNVELELKAERDNAEIRVERVEEYAAVVAAEWRLFYERLDSIAATGANVVLSKLPIGDLATQYFADRGVFCAGRVPGDDLGRVAMATGCMIQSSVHDLQLGERAGVLGRAALFEERQVGGERYNFLTGCPESKTSTFLLRGGSLQFIAEVERSLHDALLVVKRALQHQEIVGGGGSIEMAISVALRDVARAIQGKQQLVILAFARALEIIPRQLADNAGLDALQLLNTLRKAHVLQTKNNQPASWLGVNVLQGGTASLAFIYFSSCSYKPASVCYFATLFVIFAA